MPYKCVSCSKIYNKDASELRDGCECKGRFFFFISDDKLAKINSKTEKEISLTPQEKQEVEEEVREMVGAKDRDKPVYIDFESVKMIKSGRYSIDINKMFSKKDPRIYKLEDGKYIIDLANLEKKAVN